MFRTPHANRMINIQGANAVSGHSLEQPDKLFFFQYLLRLSMLDCPFSETGPETARVKLPSMLIKAYGEYWSRARVDWKNRNLHGVLKGKQRINAWRQRGIYALYDRFTIIYIGQAEARAHELLRAREVRTELSLCGSLGQE